MNMDKNSGADAGPTALFYEGGDGGVGERQEKRRRIRAAFTEAFTGEAGLLMLDYLRDSFGWAGGIERPSYRVGLSHADMCFIEGQKEVVRHILALIASEKRKGNN